VLQRGHQGKRPNRSSQPRALKNAGALLSQCVHGAASARSTQKTLQVLVVGAHSYRHPAELALTSGGGKRGRLAMRSIAKDEQRPTQPCRCVPAPTRIRDSSTIGFVNPIPLALLQFMFSQRARGSKRAGAGCTKSCKSVCDASGFEPCCKDADSERQILET